MIKADRDSLGRFLKKHGEGVKLQETAAHEAGETEEEEVEEHKTASEEADEYVSNLGKKRCKCGKGKCSCG